jgi:Lon protease-like protein
LSALLPLFPLDLVLFPSTLLPLHIFELRYREMISECLAEKKHFGVVRAEPDGLAEVGCTAEVLEVTKKYDDGRMDILTAGRERFEIMRMNQERSFLQGEVVYVPDQLNPPSANERARAISLHGELITLAGAQPEALSEIEKDNLAYHLAGSLPLDLDFKQTLLEMKSESERIRAIISSFEAILPTMRRTVHIREKAGGNGHAG